MSGRAFSSAPLARAFLNQSETGAPRIDTVAVLGFSLTHPGHIAVVSRAAAAPLPGYRGTAGFAVPKHQVVKTPAFSLHRALSSGSSSGSSSSGSGKSSGLASLSATAAGSRSSDTPAPDQAQPISAPGGTGRLFGRSRVVRRASATDAAPAAGGEGWWRVDVGGYTRKGYIAGGGKEENQDRSIVVEPFAKQGQVRARERDREQWRTRR